MGIFFACVCLFWIFMESLYCFILNCYQFFFKSRKPFLLKMRCSFIRAPYSQIFCVMVSVDSKFIYFFKLRKLHSLMLKFLRDSFNNFYTNHTLLISKLILSYHYGLYIRTFFLDIKCVIGYFNVSDAETNANSGVKRAK